MIQYEKQMLAVFYRLVQQRESGRNPEKIPEIMHLSPIEVPNS